MREATSLVELGRQLVDEGRDLVRKEIELAKVEVTELVKTNAIALGLCLTAAVLLLVFLVMLQVAIILTVPFTAQYIVAWALVGFWIVVIAILALIGRSKFKFKAPEKTIATVKGDIEWAKGQIRSNGRS
ncbi:MAG TPA: phage holin family protein [Chloroflexota bacterium]|nr:phage holin family protein [Chloroflexota bacterium]